MGIYEEVAYSYRLMQRLNQLLQVGFLVYSFSEEESFKEFLELEKPDYILVGENYYTSDLFEGCNADVVILSETEVEDNNNLDIDSYENQAKYEIFKYQSAVKMVSQLNKIINKDRPVVIKNSDGISFIGVYSPVRRCGKTSLAVALSKKFSQNKKVLYLNFEPFGSADISLKNDEAWNLSDVFYFMSQNRDSREILDKSLLEYNGMYAILPVDSLEDLQEITARQWEQFFMMLSDARPVDLIVVDFDESINCYMQLLELCDRIYMPILENSAARDKLKRFDEFLKKSNLQSVSKKIKKVHFSSNDNAAEASIEKVAAKLAEQE